MATTMSVIENLNSSEMTDALDADAPSQPGDLQVNAEQSTVEQSSVETKSELIAITLTESVDIGRVETSDVAILSCDKITEDMDPGASMNHIDLPFDDAAPVGSGNGSGEATPRIAGEEALADCIDDKFISSLLGPLNKMLGITPDLAAEAGEGSVADADANAAADACSASDACIAADADVDACNVADPGDVIVAADESAVSDVNADSDATVADIRVAADSVSKDNAENSNVNVDVSVETKQAKHKQNKTAATSENQTRKTKDSSRAKHKEDKSIEHILKALSTLHTSEEKLAALCHKYNELLEEHRLLQNNSRLSQRKITMMIREKDQLQNEHSKAVLAKSKLESLCRELQRHNKLVKDESAARCKEEEEKRKQVTTRFQTTISEIQQQMNEHHTKNTKLREENLTLATKLKNLIGQYELQEQHVEKLLKHRDLEQQLMDAKLAQAIIQITEEKKRNCMEKEIMLMEAAEGQKKIQLLETQEKQLRSQVSLYTEKYEEFQSTLAKSNNVFQSFKTEMDKMTKKIKKLEKDTNMWRTRCENSNRSLLSMAEEKARSDKETAGLHNKIKKLESLCRALQERHKSADMGEAASDEQDVAVAVHVEQEQEKEEEEKEADETNDPSDTVVVADEESASVEVASDVQTSVTNELHPSDDTPQSN